MQEFRNGRGLPRKNQGGENEENYSNFVVYRVCVCGYWR